MRWRIAGDGGCGATARVGEGHRNGDSMMMCDEEPCECDGDVDVDTAGGGSNKGQRGIKF